MGRTYDAMYLRRLRPLLMDAKFQGYAWLDCKPGEVVVDIGCGLGSDAAELAKTGAEVLGLDTNGAMIADARDAYGDVVQFHQQPAQATGLCNSSVDKLRYDRVFQHIADHNSVFEEARRILRPGGVIQITDTDYFSLSYFIADPTFERKLVDMITERLKGSRHIRYIPTHLRQLGFGQPRIAVHQLLVYGFEEAEYVLGIDEILSVDFEQYGFTASDMNIWRQWKQSGHCYLAVNIVTMQAVKEGTS